ncbi:cytochrome c oxidase accessory protein CcoG [Bdellovibrio sp. ZAP7]|uniref:cytochrome c oxidase accessory protein CcoG n=1 Tax=Bdellovibrio sp. ZAP7 TaxID=2231053 RepID=UPI001159A116|nr:cytochrome c oxidase accessory protein CcoG [Bdellovibrio sp. ZAP7]QDK45869.1 cytochrome c oxidase accessory protein CcoG [Bdellovibrio sp. ZAP7]
MSLDPNLLTSVDEHGDHIAIIPAEVKGFYKKHRTWVHAVLLVVFLALPWTSIRGVQTILINIPDREFSFFGLLFHAHDAPLLFFIIGTLVIGLAFVTAVWGRVWCGWACPQTVFIESVFRRIEQWTEGNYIERRKLREEAMTFNKIKKSGTKWVLFALVSSLIAHSLIAYFVGAKDLLHMMEQPPGDNWTYFILVSLVTAAVLFDFGWFREQFCVIMCPYGRFQSLLIDNKSLAVIYDVKRGEPRRGRNQPGEAQGDCVACNRCVNACPTGIDIRNGLQMECIACTACVDACDEIMEKVKKPKGLIRYDTLDFSKIKLTRPRPLVYMGALLILVSGLSYAIATRDPFHWTLLRGQGLPYSYVQDGDTKDVIQNQFKIHIQNQEREETSYTLSIDPELIKSGAKLTIGENPKVLKPQGTHEWYFFVRLPESSFKGTHGKILSRVTIESRHGDVVNRSDKELIIVGPQGL